VRIETPPSYDEIRPGCGAHNIRYGGDDDINRSHKYSLQIHVGELLQILIRASTVVVLEVRGVAPFQRRKSLDAEFRAERLALGGAVNVSNHLGCRPLEICDELVPVGFNGLAVTAPARLVARYNR
jgi:hypothetical protein